MIGEQCMEDMKERILMQVSKESKEYVEDDLNIFFEKVRELNDLKRDN